MSSEEKTMSKERFAQKMVEHFKIVSKPAEFEASPEELETLRKWYDDIIAAGMIVAEASETVEGPVCVFYPDFSCPVRKEIKTGPAMDKYMHPLKGSDEAQIVEKLGGAFKQMFQGEWMVLQSFCHICPYKFKNDIKLQDETMKEHVERMTKLGDLPPKPLQGETHGAAEAGPLCPSPKSPNRLHAVDITKPHPRHCIYCGELVE